MNANRGLLALIKLLLHQKVKTRINQVYVLASIESFIILCFFLQIILLTSHSAPTYWKCIIVTFYLVDKIHQILRQCKL